MKTVFTSTKHLLCKGPNQSFGNHLLHLFFAYQVSKVRKIDLGIACESNLDDLLDLSKYKTPMPQGTVILYKELFGGDLEESIQKDQINLVNAKKILYDENLVLPRNFLVEGWFYHNEVQPSKEIFDQLKIHDHLLKTVAEKYPDIQNDDVLVLHYRYGDFVNHSIGWGNLALPSKYYISAIAEMQKKFKVKKIVIVSDEPQRLKQIIRPHFDNIEIYSDTYVIDWLLLFLCKNLVCSNSSFCWTAGLFNKTNVIQPKGFLARNLSDTLVFPPNVYYNDSCVI